MNEALPRILYVCSCWPHDRAYGGQLRALHIARALQQLGRITLVIVGADQVEDESVRKTAAEFELAGDFKAFPASTHGLRNRLRSLIDSDYTNIHGLAVSHSDEKRFIELQKQFDLTWFFKLRTANLFTTARWPRSVVDVDDVPSTMEGTLQRNGANGRATWKTGLRMLSLRRHERHLHQRFNVLSVCSEADRALLRGSAPVHVIPNGFARPARPPARNPVQPPRIGFIGLFTYRPNLDGVRWFAEACWPALRQQVPGVRLRLIGAGTDGPLKPADPAIDGLGWVENPAEEIASWSAMIVPIHTGAGTRVKIPDAFSRKCPLVSTRLGAFGYEVEHGRELMLADTPRDFAAACVSITGDRVSAAAMADRAYAAFLEKWTWESITPRVLGAAEGVLRHNGRP